MRHPKMPKGQPQFKLKGKPSVSAFQELIGEVFRKAPKLQMEPHSEMYMHYANFRDVIFARIISSEAVKCLERLNPKQRNRLAQLMTNERNAYNKFKNVIASKLSEGGRSFQAVDKETENFVKENFMKDVEFIDARRKVMEAMAEYNLSNEERQGIDSKAREIEDLMQMAIERERERLWKYFL